MRIIAGEKKGRRIEAPEGRETRPTLDRVRENIFNMLQTRMGGARVLDLFAGSGALSLEALSRGAEFAVLADRDRDALRIEKKNIEALEYEEKTRVIPGDWSRTTEKLRTEGEEFDLIFLDPPYAMRDLEKVTEALLPLAAEGAWMVIEHEAKAEPEVAPGWTEVNRRSWGFCGVSIFETERQEETKRTVS